MWCYIEGAGRPVKPWNDCVGDELDAMDLICKWLRRNCQEREDWNGILEKSCNAPSLHGLK
jgi:hypothetical protein